MRSQPAVGMVADLRTVVCCVLPQESAQMFFSLRLQRSALTRPPYPKMTLRFTKVQ
jgi:hypothetical protein